MRHILLLSIALLLALAAGCGGTPSGAPAGDSTAQIQAAVDAHLAKRTDLALGDMDVRVDSVEFKGDEAEAVVSFRAPGAAEAAMSMTYQLTRTDDGWEVKPKEGMGGHGGMAPPPSADDPSLPPGHPPTGGEAPQQALPQGHPPVQQ